MSTGMSSHVKHNIDSHITESCFLFVVKRRRKRDPQEESSTSASKRQQTSKGKKALKGKQPEQPQVPGERPEPSEPPSNEEPEQPARRAFYTSSLQRKCKVSTLMNDGFEGYRVSMHCTTMQHCITNL